MVSSQILLISLRVYILHQLFFSISVNSGLRNIYLATSWLGKIFSHHSPRFQRIIVKYWPQIYSISKPWDYGGASVEPTDAVLNLKGRRHIGMQD